MPRAAESHRAGRGGGYPRCLRPGGADIITANTFGASRRKLGEDPAPYIAAGIALAKRAGADTGAYAALDVGPLGGMLEPFGDMAFDEVYAMFSEIMEAGAAAGRTWCSLRP